MALDCLVWQSCQDKQGCLLAFIGSSRRHKIECLVEQLANKCVSLCFYKYIYVYIYIIQKWQGLLVYGLHRGMVTIFQHGLWRTGFRLKGTV